ncbi:uncharacterized protein (TIGR02118 family) [Friedmanniella endophytica]|uniref:Uncharacterized protein (TIGR02118 family) n=2 Tax=Microlunatus kandeliicorticis TaxID=1759536 RepID=A0A7W3IPU3_9ACTN|nr:uncharacterized protein (TIGR02118 family) [Microlunatus kandeliicorticis]
MTILYERPDDLAAFRRYYEDTHVPLARRMPGLTGWNLCWLDEAAGDAAADGVGAGTDWALVAELYTVDREAMTAMLDSPEGRAARADLDNFVTARVVFLTGDEVEVALA